MSPSKTITNNLSWVAITLALSGLATGIVLLSYISIGLCVIAHSILLGAKLG
jgi:hypothetical protein